MHQCPVDGCAEMVAFDKLMCWRHWRRVPRDVQRRVYVAWNHGHPTDDYLAVRDEAIAAVNVLEAPR